MLKYNFWALDIYTIYIIYKRIPFFGLNFYVIKKYSL